MRLLRNVFFLPRQFRLRSHFPAEEEVKSDFQKGKGVAPPACVLLQLFSVATVFFHLLERLSSLPPSKLWRAWPKEQLYRRGGRKKSNGFFCPRKSTLPFFPLLPSSPLRCRRQRFSSFPSLCNFVLSDARFPPPSWPVSAAASTAKSL